MTDAHREELFTYKQKYCSHLNRGYDPERDENYCLDCGKTLEEDVKQVIQEDLEEQEATAE